MSDGVRAVPEGSGQVRPAERAGLEGESPPTASVHCRVALPAVAGGAHRPPGEVPPLPGALYVIKSPIPAFDPVSTLIVDAKPPLYIV